MHGVDHHIALEWFSFVLLNMFSQTQEILMVQTYIQRSDIYNQIYMHLCQQVNQ